MKKRTVLVAAVIVLALAGGAVVTRDIWTCAGRGRAGTASQSAGARHPGRDPGVARTKTVPLQIELLGTVTPIASVAIKSRLDTEIIGVHFDDGAMVQKGDLLFTLDGRAIEAQIRDLEAVLTQRQAQLEQNERDLRRYTELVAKNADPGPAIKVQASTPARRSTSGARPPVRPPPRLENLRVQLS